MTRVELVRLAGEGPHIVRSLPWLRPSRPDGYWHQPRSASRRPDGRLSILTWCGQMRYEPDSMLAADAPESMRCGTCHGRRQGFDRADGLIFTPRDPWALPTRCPGEADDDDRNCVACGARVSAARGWWASGIAKHRPAPELAARLHPCPRHGWRDIRPTGDTFACFAWRGSAGRCDWNPDRR